MYDGVHADFILKQKWYSYLFKSVQNEITNQYSRDSDDSDIEQEQSWDFKRVK